jgi:WD40 repeat protein
MSKPVEIELEHVIGFTGHNLHTVTASRLDPKRFYYPIGSVIVDASLDDPHDQRFMTGHDAEISTIVPSSSGRLLASGQEECRTKTGRVSPILVWDATSRKLIYTLQGHTSGIIAVAWSSDDRFIVSSGKDGRLCIWDVETGACVGGHRPSESPASFLQWVRLADPTSRRPVYNVCFSHRFCILSCCSICFVSECDLTY